jgi:hypothetical protein
MISSFFESERFVMRRFKVRLSSFGFSLLAAVTVVVGCGPAGPTLIPVSGKVTLSGTPLKSGTINLVADESKGTKQTGTSAGKIQPDGSYTISTDGKDGAPPGWYKAIVITKYPGAPEDAVAINPVYTDPKSAISFEVVANPAAGAYDLKLTK